MLVYGGYFVKEEELVKIFQSEAKTSDENDIRAYLHQYFADNLRNVDAIAVRFPRGSQQEKFQDREPADGTLFQTRMTYSNFKYLKDCPDIEENDEDRKTKECLERKGIENPQFVTVPDPYLKHKEDWNVGSQ